MNEGYPKRLVGICNFSPVFRDYHIPNDNHIPHTMGEVNTKHPPCDFRHMGDVTFYYILI